MFAGGWSRVNPWRPNKTAAVLRKIRPTDPVGAMRRHTIVELLAGQREMNKVLHIAARVQSNMPNSDGRLYVHRKLGEGKTRAEATRSLKRHLSNVVYRALQADLVAHEVSGEDNQAA